MNNSSSSDNNHEERERSLNCIEILRTIDYDFNCRENMNQQQQDIINIRDIITTCRGTQEPDINGDVNCAVCVAEAPKRSKFRFTLFSSTCDVNLEENFYKHILKWHVPGACPSCHSLMTASCSASNRHQSKNPKCVEALRATDYDFHHQL